MRWPTRGSPAAFAKLVRRGAGLLAEKTGEVRRIGKCQFLRNALDRQRGENERAFCFGQEPLADQMTGGDAGRAFDVTVASAGCSVMLPVRARLAASRATSTAISARRLRIAMR
jgi:hypothetical protein